MQLGDLVALHDRAERLQEAGNARRLGVVVTDERDARHLFPVDGDAGELDLGVRRITERVLQRFGADDSEGVYVDFRKYPSAVKNAAAAASLSLMAATKPLTTSSGAASAVPCPKDSASDVSSPP